MGASRILSRLRHKGQITEEEYRKMMDIKNSERHMQKVCEEIRAEIEQDMLFYEEDNCNDKDTGFVMGLQHTLDIIDRHMEGDSE